MNKREAERLVEVTFTESYDEGRFRLFTRNLFDAFAEKSESVISGKMIWDAFKGNVTQYKRLGKYTDPEGYIVDVLAVKLKDAATLERARTLQRNFVARYLNGGRGYEREAALVAFYAEGTSDWRFSLVRMEYVRVPDKDKFRKELTPARRYSFLVGGDEKTHTAQKQLATLLQGSAQTTLSELEHAFNIESVTKEFFKQYKELFLNLKEELDDLERSDPRIRREFAEKTIDTATFAKRLLGQIVFLYFLQKKGWLGVGRRADGTLEPWGYGPKDFLRRLFKGEVVPYDNFFDDLLEPLFYEALASDRSEASYYSRFECRIPFLNGGLFEPVGGYNWQETRINLRNETFAQIFDTFDLYNFTVREDEPLDKEVAVDPEMLGKVFENLLEVKDRKFKGAFYTPREIVHYMCQESLINYLDTALNTVTRPLVKQTLTQNELFGRPQTQQAPLTEDLYEAQVPRADIEHFVRFSELLRESERAYNTAQTAIREGQQKTTSLESNVPESIKQHAGELDAALANIKICDPAIGSGAFPVGMMNEIVRARETLTEVYAKFNSAADRALYDFKRHAIQESIYGVDIDASAVDIAKLRLWLSLVVDEDDLKEIKALPNLEYKISSGNLLLGVEEPLFNDELLDELENLKQRYFGETQTSQKSVLKKQVKELTRRIVGSDEAFDFEVYFSEVFRKNGKSVKGGFDVVIANPPYIGEKGNKELFRPVKERKLKNFYKGKMDYFYFFFHLALNLVKDKGQIAFITTNYYVTATGAPKLRRDFKERSIVRKLIDFNELKIFETAKGQHNMVTILSKGRDESHEAETVITAQTGIATPAMLQAVMTGTDNETKFYRKAQVHHRGGPELYIRLAGDSENSTNSIERVLDGIKEQSASLGTIFNVNQGIVTSADKVTPKHLDNYSLDANKGDGIFILSQKEVTSLSLNEEDSKILKPWYKNSDARRYFTGDKTNQFLIFADKRLRNLENNAVKQHLAKFKSIIDTASSNAPYLHRPRDINFDSPKIVAPQRSYTNTFGYNEISWYASADVYFITPRGVSTGVQLKYVLTLLNSKLYYTWLYHRGKRKGEMLELYQTPLSEIPIKKISVAEQKPFVDLADNILSVTSSGDYLTNSEKQIQVKGYESQIDRLVYRLYGLTEEEIRIVEELVSK